MLFFGLLLLLLSYFGRFQYSGPETWSKALLNGRDVCMLQTKPSSWTTQDVETASCPVLLQIKSIMGLHSFMAAKSMITRWVDDFS